MLQLFHHRREQVERVALDIVGEDAAGGEHEHLLVLLQLAAHIAGNGKQGVDAAVVVGGEEIGDVAVDETGYLSQLLHVHLCGNVARQSRCVAFGKFRHVVLYRLHHHVGIGLCSVAVLEHGENPVRPSNVLIHVEGVVVVAVEGQEVGYVLLVTEPHHRHHEEGGGEEERQQRRHPVSLQIRVYP